MTPLPTRRTVLTTLATGALVAGLDPLTRTWVAAAAETGPLHGLPGLDGTLRTDPASLQAAADDYGHTVHRTPLAVLEPGSVADVAAMVRFCRAHRLPVAPRGQGHGTSGQAQVANGLVIETAPLASVEVRGSTVVAGAGAKWSDVLRATLAAGLTPDVLTDYIELSVGGTLSVGGLGGATHHHGAQVDNVLELEVVTGAGERVVCSPGREPALFDAVLSGLGQCAIITRATLRLYPAPSKVRRYLLPYPGVAALTADQRRLVRDGRFGYVEGQLGVSPASYALEAVAYFAGDVPPDDAALLGDLAFERGAETIDDEDYLTFLDRLAPVVSFLESIGEWQRPHVWWNGFLPDGAADAFVAGALAGLTPASVGASAVVLLYPFRRGLLHRPLLRVPDGELAFLFAVLRTASPGADGTDAMLAANRALYEKARDAGGFQYPVGSIPFTPADWRRHYGPAWPAFAAAKRRYDPAGILTPGQGVFG